MARVFRLLVALGLLTTVLLAQTAPAPRLAIVPGTDVPPELADLLTVGLSSKPSLQLLEREQISRVLREQALAAHGRDALRLGQLLGAEGLLLLEVVSSGTNRSLHSRLLAVKSGVHLASARSQLPLPEPDRWASNLASRFEPLFSKLSVATHDAIPLSIVNLRAAVASDASRDLERQLTFLSIERLSLDPRLFVLERRRMDLLADEKELQPADDTAFWNGRYLLEGTIDRDGSSPDTVTLDARLAGPGGSPVTDIALKGPRNNLPALVEQLAVRVLEILRRPAAPVAWKPDSEATRFLEEARWAFKWRLWPEAQSAADAAWALGRHDVDTAFLRVRSLLPELRQDESSRQSRSFGPSGARLDAQLNALFQREPGAIYRVRDYRGTPSVDYVRATKTAVTPAQIAQASRALNRFEAFCRFLPPSEPKPGSDWYLVGIEALTAAGDVLRSVLLSPRFMADNAEAVAALRADSRRVAELFLKSGSVREDYWTRDKYITYDTLWQPLTEAPNLFQCLLLWGPFMQETPDDGIRLHRRLMDSPVFSYLYRDFWFRETGHPYVVGWTTADRKRAHAVWEEFVRELEASTDVQQQLHGRALRAVSATDTEEYRSRFNSLLELFQKRRADFLRLDIGPFHHQWGLPAIQHASTHYLPELLQSPAMKSVQALEGEWRIAAEARTRKRSADAIFPRQKAYLETAGPAPMAEFDKQFPPEDPLRRTLHAYDRDQAAELLRLLLAYKERVDAANAATNAPARRPVSPHAALIEVHLRGIIGAPAAGASRPPVAGRPAQGLAPVHGALLKVTNFVAVPLAVLTNGLPDWQAQGFAVNGVHWTDTHAWFDVRFTHHNVALLRRDHVTGRWDRFARIPQGQVERTNSPAGHWHGGHFYVSDHGALWTLNGTDGTMTRRAMPWTVLPRLFSVHGRLFAANPEMILELRGPDLPDLVLASTRRRPGTTRLDLVESLGTPSLLEGPNDTLRAYAAEGIHEWDGKDWTALSDRRLLSAWPGETGIALAGDVSITRRGIWTLPQHEARPVLALSWDVGDVGMPRQDGPSASSRPGSRPAPSRPGSAPGIPQPAWQSVQFHMRTSATYLPMGPHLMAYIDESASTNNAMGWLVPVARLGRHASLYRFRQGDPTPRVVSLFFDPAVAYAPSRNLLKHGSSYLETDRSIRLLPTRDHLLILQSSLGGVWMLPWKELDAAFDRPEALTHPPEPGRGPG